MVDEKILASFTDHFKSLSLKDREIVGQIFNEKTGGRLSAYNNPIPVVVAIIQVDNLGLLGIRRGTEPHINGLCLPGGYQEELEEPTVALTREVLEETGLITNPSDFHIFGNPLVNKRNNQLLFFKYSQIISLQKFQSLTPTEEVLSFELINKESKLCFPLHNEKILDFFK